jgi:hypothetical protein
VHRFSNQDAQREDERQFVQQALLRFFKGDTQLLHRDFPEFWKEASVQELVKRFSELQGDVYVAWTALSYGQPEPDLDLHSETPDIAPEAADPDLSHEALDPTGTIVDNGVTLVEEIVIDGVVEAEMPVEDFLAEEESEGNTPAEPEEMTPVAEEIPTDAPVAEEAPSEVTENLEASPIDPPIEAELPESESPQDPTPVMETPAPKPPTIVKLTLPNGKIDVDYDQQVPLTQLGRLLEDIDAIESAGFTDFGLAFDAETLRIKGIPTQSGNFKVLIHVKYLATSQHPAQEFQLQGEIEIMPDPRKLWKDLEPDATLPYQKPHSDHEMVTMMGRTMIAASRRGRSHAHSGTFRDDDFKLSVIESEGWYILAVADGAGSAPYSRRGSQIACDKAVEVLEAKLDAKLAQDLAPLGEAWKAAPNDTIKAQIARCLYEPLSHAAYAGYKAIGEEAKTLGEEPKAFHTTLLLTVVRLFDFGYFVGTWWVGDGGVGVYQRGKYIKPMGVPDGGQFAGQTRFLTMPEIWADGATIIKRIEFDIVDDFTAVVLMSDGVTDPKIQTDYNLGQVSKWDELWNDLENTVDFSEDNLQADAQLLEWLDFWSPGEHDDRTIAILY